MMAGLKRFLGRPNGLVGSVSLIDPDAAREAYVVSFMPDDGTYLVEEATAWEDVPEDKPAFRQKQRRLLEKQRAKLKNTQDLG